MQPESPQSAPWRSFIWRRQIETEARYRILWKRFYDTIAIPERENP